MCLKISVLVKAILFHCLLILRAFDFYLLSVMKIMVYINKIIDLDDLCNHVKAAAATIGWQDQGLVNYANLWIRRARFGVQHGDAFE